MFLNFHTFLTFVVIYTLQSYPMTKFGRQNRSFNASIYGMYDWVEYSLKNDAIYCFPCRNFSSKDIDATLTFTKIGFKNWKKVR